MEGVGIPRGGGLEAPELIYNERVGNSSKSNNASCYTNFEKGIYDKITILKIASYLAEFYIEESMEENTRGLVRLSKIITKAEKKQMTSTGEMITWFLDSNDLTINQLAEASGVTPKTVYRVINEEAKLSNKIALGLHKLLPGIRIEDIVAYDAKFQFENGNMNKPVTN